MQWTKTDKLHIFYSDNEVTHNDMNDNKTTRENSIMDFYSHGRKLCSDHLVEIIKKSIVCCLVLCLEQEYGKL